MIRILSGWDEPFLEFGASSAPSLVDCYDIHDSFRAYCRDEECELYALVNPARNEMVLSILAMQELEHRSLYRGTGFERFFEVSPILVSVNSFSKSLKRLFNETWGTGSCIWIACPAGFDDVASHLSQFITVEHECGIEVVFRFFDPTILFHFLRASTEREVDFFLGPIRAIFLELDGSAVVEFSRREDSSEGSHRGASNGEEASLFRMQGRHMRSFRGLMRTKFEEYATSRVVGLLASSGQAVEAQSVTPLVSAGIYDAKKFGLSTRRHIVMYLECVALAGKDFLVNPTGPIATAIGDETSDAAGKIEAAHEVIVRGS